MTVSQLVLLNCLYLAILVAVIYFTRATLRRFTGALAGGATFALMAIGVLALGEGCGWWQLPDIWTPYVLALLYFDLAISCTPIYLITWRVTRRFGWRGLAALAGAASVIGPVRDQQVSETFPQ